MGKTTDKRAKRRIATPIGNLLLIADGDALAELRFGGGIAPDQNPASDENPVLDQAQRELEEYFVGERREFRVKLAPRGTAFQTRVWAALCEIPYGETRSYQDVARMIGNEKACRAVGLANNRNPIPVIIPCHRVVGKNGALVGYGGGLDIKQALLALEARL